MGEHHQRNRLGPEVANVQLVDPIPDPGVDRSVRAAGPSLDELICGRVP
jgi:hypothetical protein